MGIVLGIVSTLLIIAMAIIFLLYKVLKNTLNMFEKSVSANGDVAYDDCYYPGSVIATLKYDCPEDMIIADFSQYEENELIGITIYNKERYLDSEFGKAGIPREVGERPQFFSNVIVFQPMEGMWKWK